MSVLPKTIAFIFDFDDTLIPDSTSQLLREYGVDPERFWEGNKPLVLNGYDPAHAFLKSFIGLIGKDKPLGELTNADLKSFGRKLDSKFYPGVKRMFGDLRKVVGTFKKFDSTFDVKFFIVSGGLEDVIRGSTIVQDNFAWTVGCRLSGDTGRDWLKHIKRCITFTEKTRFLFEINKFGLHQEELEGKPYNVNRDIPQNTRDIPFQNMVYVGDGLTDIPCFSLVKSMKGMSFGVFNPSEPNSAKRALREFLKTDRVISMHAPKYRPNDELGSFLRSAAANRCADLNLDKYQAEDEYKEA